METSYLKTLELDKIIARAAEGCVCREAKAQMLALEPQCDPDEVRYSLEQTDAINSLLIKNGSPRFGGVEGVGQLVTRAVKGGVLSMGELLMVAGALRNFQNLSSWYGSSDHEALPTDDLFYALAPQPGLEQQISSAILAPDAMADTASRTLNELRKKIHATENSIRDRLETMVRNMDTSKYLQESVVSMRNGRYVVPVKSEYRGEVSGIIHDVSSTGATVFVEPQAVVEANARILQYRAQEAQEIERILVAFTAQVAAIEPQFQYSYKAMLEIDVLLAKARLALDMKAFKPAVRTDSSFSLIRARHPLIDPKKCVPVDIALGRDYDSLIITGPNTGGKTVTLKTAGLLCAMAQCGFLIPADERSENLSDIPTTKELGMDARFSHWQGVIAPRGMAGLGWGLPMALGAAVAEPEAPIYCITGDGGFAHVWSEMEVAARSNLKVTTIVLNNGILGYVKCSEKLRYGKNSTSVDIFPIDHVVLAQACGLQGIRVEHAEELLPALEQARLSETSTLIEVMCSGDCPPITDFVGK